VSWRIGIEDQFQVAQVNGLAGPERRFPHPRMVNAGAVSGTQIPDEGIPIIDHDLAVGARDGRVIEREVVDGAPPKGISASLELDFPGIRRSGLDYKSRHNYRSTIRSELRPF
jgi:hypothetical protein